MTYSNLKKQPNPQIQEELTRKEKALEAASEDWNKALVNGKETIGKLSELMTKNGSKINSVFSALGDYKNKQGELQKMFYGSTEKGATKKEKNGFLGNTTNKMSDEFTDELNNMIMGYTSFKESMQRIGSEMTEYLVKNALDGIMKMVITKQNASLLLGATQNALGFGGNIISTGFNFVKKLVGFHSGGIIPSGANYSLPGSKEQLAMLKGGERVLSPAENTSYDNNSGGSPVVFNNFNVKAWDSKDVSKYLLENKQLLNAITFEGIKYNNGHLRTMVRNA